MTRYYNSPRIGETTLPYIELEKRKPSSIPHSNLDILHCYIFIFLDQKETTERYRMQLGEPSTLN